MSNFRCCICGKVTDGFGNNPNPIIPQTNFGNQCCDWCNNYIVIPARIAIVESKERGESDAE